MLCVYLAMCETEEEKIKFKKIYDGYKGMINGIATRILKNPQDAEDAVQESFIKIIQNLDSINLKSRNKTRFFIDIIVRRTCINLINKKKREPKTTEFDEENDEIFTMPTFEEPLTALMGKQGAELIMQQIDSLDDIYRSVVILKVSYGYSDEKIAKILGITANTVRVRMSRAKVMLKNLIASEKEI